MRVTPKMPAREMLNVLAFLNMPAREMLNVLAEHASIPPEMLSWHFRGWHFRGLARARARRARRRASSDNRLPAIGRHRRGHRRVPGDLWGKNPRWVWSKNVPQANPFNANRMR